MDGRIPILFEMTLRERGPQAGHTICCRIVRSENMKWFIGAEHKMFNFVVQATTINCSLGISVDQFRYDEL